MTDVSAGPQAERQAARTASRVGFTRLGLAVCLYLSAATTLAGDALETFLSTNPSVEARREFAAGDRRHIVIPVCIPQGGEVIPGWPLEGPTPPAMWVALENGRRPFQCADIGEGTKSADFIRLLKYAEQYNRELLDLEAARGK